MKVFLRVLILGIAVCLLAGAMPNKKSLKESSNSEEAQVEAEAADSNQPVAENPTPATDWRERAKQRQLGEIQQQIAYEQARFEERIREISKIMDAATGENATQTVAMLEKFLVMENKRWEIRLKSLEQRKDKLNKFGVQPSSSATSTEKKP